MGINKTLIYISIACLLLAFYLHNAIEKDKQKEFFLRLVIKIFDILSVFDNFLRHFDTYGLRRKSDVLFANYMYSKINKSGLIVNIRKFNDVEVIMFDVMNHEKRRPAILFIHGGGWGYMSTKFYSALTADIARRLNTLVVSVEYRLAPEHPYPAGYDDVMSATKYLFENAAQFDIDPTRVAIMGDSAGGNLAMAVSYELSIMREHRPKLLVPLSPVLQIADMRSPSLVDNVEDYILNKRQLIASICYYAFGLVSRSDLLACIELMTSNGHLNEETYTSVSGNLDWMRHFKQDNVGKYSQREFSNEKNNKFITRLSQLSLDPRFSPLSALNDSMLSVLPSMLVFGASKDPLRDDARLLAARASAVGITAVYEEVDAFHDPFLLVVFGMSRGTVALDTLERVFKMHSLL